MITNCVLCGSPIVEVASLLAEMVQHGLRCLAFCNTRKLCELVHNYTYGSSKGCVTSAAAAAAPLKGF